MAPKVKIRSFRDLEIFQESYELSLIVNRQIITKLPKEEKYDLVDQLRRSSKAVPRLIAEGYSKRHQAKGFQKYLDDALAESNETIVSLSHAKDLYSSYVDVKLVEQLLKRYDILSRKIFTLASKWNSFSSRTPSSTSNPNSKPT